MNRPETNTQNAAPAWTPARSAVGLHNPWLVAVVVALPVFLELLDTTIANVALRNIAGSLSSGTEESTWVITSYLVANAIVLPVSGWLCDVVGRKRFFMACVAMFTVASLLCGTATSFPALIVFRVIQGLGGGGMVPISQLILAESFPPAKRGLAFAIWGMAVVVSPILGPPLGGWLTETYSWPWIFFLNVPMGLLALLLCWLFLEEPPLLVAERRQRWAAGIRLDYVGFLLAAAGLACLEVVLSKGEIKGWFDSGLICAFAGVAGGALLALVLWEWRRRQPVVEVTLFRWRTFSMSFVMMFGAGMVLYSSNTFVPMLMQLCHGYTAFTAGLVVMPGGIGAAIGMLGVGVLTRYVQLRYLVAAGLVLQIGPYLQMCGFTPDLTFWQVAMVRMVAAVGLGFLFVPVMALSYEGLPAGAASGATTLTNIARNIGGSFGISMANTWLVWRTQYHHSVLVEHLTPYNPQVTEALARVQLAAPAAGGGDPLTDPVVLTAVDGLVSQQAAVMAFNDIFFLSAILCAGMLLLVPLLARNQPGHGDMMAGH